MSLWNRIWMLVAFLSVLLAACGKQKSVANVDGKNIPADEFRDRYKAYIETQASTRDNILLRRQILNNMINEQLIYSDVHRQGFDSDDRYEDRMQEIRAQAMLDRYARSISTDTVSVSETELWNEFHSYNSKVKARYLYARTESEALALKGRLEHGAAFADLAKEVFQDPGLANNGGDLGYFGWGEMDPALEEAAFSLPIGRISDPIRMRMGFAIIQVEDRVEVPLASEYDYAKTKDKLQRAIIDRKVVRLIDNSAHQIEKNLGPTFNDEAVKRVYDNWQFVFKDQPGVTPKEVQPRLDDISDLQMVSFQGHSWTVADFLKKVQKTTKKQRSRVRNVDDVKAVVSGLAVRDILLAKARQAGFESDRSVVEQIEKARQLYLLKRWASSVQDTVGDHGWDERLLRDQYEKNKEQYAVPPLVDVAEILLRTEDEAKAIIKQLKRGANFSNLARKYSIRLWAAKQGGELGYGTKANYGTLGEKIFAAKLGEIIGPEFVDPYDGIFKIMGKKEGRQKTFDEAREDIVDQLKLVRKQEVFKEAVENLRKRSRFSIDNDVLANVEVK